MMNILLNNSKEKLLVGRAATGIYLILKKRFTNVDILVPANICYAAVYPIVYSGNNPIFCDVNINSGNITLDLFKKYITPYTKAAIVPHMFGNPVLEIEEISNFCKQHNIILIEDCASAMGACINGKIVGSFGDYSLFSTGYSKTLDLGGGGFVISDCDMTDERTECLCLNEISEDIKNKINDFSRKYREFRNGNIDFAKSDFFMYAKSDLRDLFIFRSDQTYDGLLKSELEELNNVVSIRRYKNKLYDSLIDYSCPFISKYEYIEGSVPWRKNIFVSENKKKNIVKYLLDNNIPVSDWYPSIAYMFGDYQQYRNTESMEKRILNFPLLISDNEIERICYFLNKFI